MQVAMIKKIKLEKAEEMKKSNICSTIPKQRISRGMEVVLTSPNSSNLAALGTIQTADINAVGLDGDPLSDYVEVMVNIVYRETTVLPRPLGRMTRMGNAQAKCIPWPRNHVSIS